MIIKDTLRGRLKERRPTAMLGKVGIDLTDPITGKVVERVCGKNRVYPDALFTTNWLSRIGSMFMCLNDSDKALNPLIPFVFGNCLGYGKPGAGSQGALRGAANMASQVIAQKTVEKVRWKFVYDFTTTQANGIIKNVGLTAQHSGGDNVGQPMNLFAPAGAYYASIDWARFVSDGRFIFNITIAGVITRRDSWLGVEVTIDVSSIVGNNNSKSVGFSPSTGKYYIWRYTGTPADNRLYEFSDMTFSTLLNTYSTVSNYNAITNVFYVHGNKAFFFDNVGVTILDFVGNVLTPRATLNNVVSNVRANETTCPSIRPDTSTTAAPGTSLVYLCVNSSNNNYIYTSATYDLSTESICSVQTSPNVSNSGYGAYILPVLTEKIPSWNGYQNAAITSYILPTPVEKTSANGMIATYELEVYW